MSRVRGLALAHPRPLVRSGVRPGPITHCLWVRGVRAREPVTDPTARTLASWRCALWGRHEGARGGHLLPGCGASGVGRLPTPDHSSVRACGRGPLHTSCGCRGCGHGDPSPTPRRALLPAGFARCGGGMRVPGGGASCLGVGRPGSGALQPHEHSSFRVCGRGPLLTGCGCGGCGRGDPSPTPQRALLRAGFERCGGGMRVPGEGAFSLGVGHPGANALPPPTSRPFGRAAGAHYPLAVGAGGAGVGTRHQPHSAHSCELALRAVGAAGGRPGGAPLSWVWGVRGQALSQARPLVRSGVRLGPSTRWLWVQGVRAWEPVTYPTARALASWLCALWGRHEAAWGGRLLPGCGASGVGRSPRPRPIVRSGVRPGPTTHWLWVRGVQTWGPVTNPRSALLRAGFARCGGGMRVPGGGASCLGVGRPGTGALQPPTSRPLGRAAGAHYPLAVCAAGAGVGTRHQPRSARPCDLALRAVGAA